MVGQITSPISRPPPPPGPSLPSAGLKNVNTPSGPRSITTVPPQNFPKLQAIARTDLHLSNGDLVDRNLWQTTFQRFSTAWNTSPGFSSSQPSPHIAANIFNVRGSYNWDNSNSVAVATAALMPFTPAFKSDLQVSLISQATSTGMKFSGLNIFIGVGTASGALIRPFDATQPPGARLTAPGRRWTVSTIATSNGLTISLTANNAAGYWDISVVKDLSIVLQDVQVNWAGNSDTDIYTVTITVEEKYVLGMGRSVSTFANTRVQVGKVDVSKP